MMINLEKHGQWERQKQWGNFDWEREKEKKKERNPAGDVMFIFKYSKWNISVFGCPLLLVSTLASTKVIQ